MKPSPSRHRHPHKWHLSCSSRVPQKAPQARHVSNRRWSANAVSAEPADSRSKHSSALQGLNPSFSPCRAVRVKCSLPAGSARYARSTDGYSYHAPSGLLSCLCRYLCLQGEGWGGDGVVRNQRSGIRNQKNLFLRGYGEKWSAGVSPAILPHAKARSREGTRLPPLHSSPLSRLRERGWGEGGGDVRNQRSEARNQKCVIASEAKQSSDFFCAHFLD